MANILSLFDGIACGHIAMEQADIPIDCYIAYEIDKYAIQTATHNFPDIIEKGDVFNADFTQYKGQVDYLIGGSPCTYWSIAQKNNRETEASGLGWELFSQYVRALREAEPKYFLYENNKSMSKAIRESITETFGFEPICINSALVSAQNRQRLYWVGKREADGTYSKVHIEQPEDRGILLKDILETGCGMSDKSHCVMSSCARTTTREYFIKNQGDMCAEPCCMRYERDETAKVLRKDYEAGLVSHGFHEHHELHPREDGKSNTISTVLKDNPICEPVCVAQRGRNPENPSSRIAGEYLEQRYEAKTDGKTNVITRVQKDNMVAEPVNITADGKSQTIKSQYHKTSPSNILGYRSTYGATGSAEPVGYNCCVTPCEWNENGEPVKAISCADGKTYTVYKVADGQITIKGKTYPIKLVDGYYIIRKLTVRECARLQTIPEWYEFACSDSQSYKQIGNGWTISVIEHLLRATKE